MAVGSSKFHTKSVGHCSIPERKWKALLEIRMSSTKRKKKKMKNKRKGERKEGMHTFNSKTQIFMVAERSLLYLKYSKELSKELSFYM